MAKDPKIEALLIEWAQWLKVGDGSGFPIMSVLSADWMPPTPGQSPTMKVSYPNRSRRLHRLIQQLSQRLGNTLIVHYCLQLPIDEQAARLACAASTVHARVDFAHRELRRLILDQDGKQKEFYQL